MSECKTAWIAKSKLSVTSWGMLREWGSLNRGVHGKILKMKAGGCTSMKFYKTKNETLFIANGKVKATFGNEKTLQDPAANPWQEATLDEGACLNVQSGCPYQLLALEDSIVIEIGDHCDDEAIRIHTLQGT